MMAARSFSSRFLRVVFFFGLLPAILDGCTVGPNYQRPQPEAPLRWSEIHGTGVTTEPVGAEIIRWWTLFGDPELDSLIDRAVRSNLDLKIAGARVREARAQRVIAGADAYPSLSASALYSRTGRSENGTSSSPAGGFAPFDLFQAGFDSAWEMDVFGGVRRSVEAATADIEASEENRRDVLISLLAEVARNYLEVRAEQRRIAIAQDNIGSQKETLELTKARLEAGLSSELEVAQAQAQLSTTESTVPGLESARRQAIHQLGVLLGVEPGALIEELSREAPIPSATPEIPIGLPSDLLRRRPDVRRAERQLAAATARIGVATADLFPQFSLTGATGLQSIAIDKLARIGSGFWSFGPTVSWNVFDAGKIRANIEVQNARQEQALDTYEKAILTALTDVENALVAYANEQLKRRSLSRAVDANHRSSDIAGELYSKGLVDFLNVLDSQRLLYQSRDQLVQSDQNVSAGLVALFKALGGGWKEDPEASIKK